jgi:hypothetical protein
MFNDHWRTWCRSQDSAGKRTCKTPYFWRSTILEKYPEIHIISEYKSSQKEEVRGTAGGHTTRWRGPTPGRTALWWGHPGPLLPSLPRVYCHPQKPKSGGSDIDTAASAGWKTPREKSSPAGRNQPGKFFPGEGRSSPSSSSSHWNSSGSSSPSSSSSAPSSPPSPRDLAVTSWVESCQILRGNFLGVDYFCSWCYWVEPLN